MKLNPSASHVRPVLAGQLGAVSAAHPLAAAAGQEMLAAGGGAVDAAIAAQAMLCVVLPGACSLGGDAFFLVREPNGEVVAVNGAGAAASRQSAPSAEGGASVTVPGMVSAWTELASRWGRLPLDRCLAPAIRVARSGFWLDAYRAGATDQHRQRLFEGGAGTWSLLALSEGELWIQPQLAAALEVIAEKGNAALYRGELAAAIVKAVRAHGGALETDDLAAHATEVKPPITLAWRDFEIAVQPPHSQGVLIVMVLANLQRLGDLPRERLGHAAVELTISAFAYRDRAAEGPALLSEILACDLDRATRRGGPRGYLHTAGVAAADRDGAVVSSLCSIFDQFGSAVFVPEGGFVLNDRGGGFTAAPNDFAPGKRPVHTLAPMLVSRDGLCLGLSTPGADGQVQTLLQVLLNWAVRGQDLAAAIDAPRWRSENGRLLVEAGHPETELLRDLGHDLVELTAGDNRFGAVTAAGTFRGIPFAVSDWRRQAWTGVA